MFTVTDITSKRKFLKNLISKETIENVNKAEVINPVFGKGVLLSVSLAGRDTLLLALYPSQPFVFISQKIHNSGTEELDINKLTPVSFEIDLGKSANLLKTLGTGGLLTPDKNPGSYIFLTTVDPVSRNGVVAGWLTQEKGSGVLFSTIKNEKVEINPQIDYGHYYLPAGCSGNSETLLVGYFDDARIGEELFANVLAKQYAIKLPERKAVYCSWYAEKNGGAGDEKSTIELAHFAQSNLTKYGLGAIQLDDWWQDGGKYNGPRRGFDRVAPNGGYPNGMNNSTRAITEGGMYAGIWWMPFARNHQDPEYANRQHWFALRLNGKPYETSWGGTSLDLTNPEVKEHIKFICNKMTDWGFNYFKMDGLWTGTVTEQVYINDGYKNDSIGNCKPLYNRLTTQIEAFRSGLKLIRETTKGNVFLSGCCASQNMRSFGGAIGLVDAMRIGPDFNHDGESIRTGAIRASRLYFLNGRVWWNDPDPSIVRESGAAIADSKTKGIGKLSRARLLPSFVAVSGQLFLTSDWLPDLPADRLDILKHCMASHYGVSRPVDAFDKSLPAIWLTTDKKTGTERNVIGLFNWLLTPQVISSGLKWAGLNENQEYYVFDFWNKKPLDNIKDSFSYKLPEESCCILAVRAKSNHPVVVSTSQHITQGMIDVLEEKWDRETLTGTSKLIGGDDYEIRIAGLNDSGIRVAIEAKLLDGNSNDTISILPATEKGWLRIAIKSNDSKTIKWQIKFSKNNKKKTEDYSL